MKYISFSLDCELAWGFADLEPPVERVEKLRNDPSRGRDAYRTILNLFDRYDIPATFAFVGHLFLDSCTDQTHPANHLTTPGDPYSSMNEDQLYYGPDLVEMVKDATVDHDIGGHSFSHPDFRQIDRETADAELAALTDIAADAGVDVTSFVYPRNSVAHADLLPEYGIQTYRELTVGENYILRRGLKPFLTADRHFWSVPPVSPTFKDDGVISIAGSRLLHEVRWMYIHPIRLRRTLAQMNEDEIIHFCFHPHDMLGYFKLDWILDRILQIVATYRNRGSLEVVTMADIPGIVDEAAAK